MLLQWTSLIHTSALWLDVIIITAAVWWWGKLGTKRTRGLSRVNQKAVWLVSYWPHRRAFCVLQPWRRGLGWAMQVQSVAQAGSWVCPLPWGLRRDIREETPVLSCGCRLRSAWSQAANLSAWVGEGAGGSQESMSAGAAVSDASVLPDLILLRKIKNPNLYEKSFNF